MSDDIFDDVLSDLGVARYWIDRVADQIAIITHSYELGDDLEKRLRDCERVLRQCAKKCQDVESEIAFAPRVL